MTHRKVLGTLSIVLFVVACSSTPSSDPDAGSRIERPADAGVDAPREPDAALIERPEPDGGLDASLPCNDIVQTGPLVAASAGTGMPTAPTGGTIIDGEYVLTASAFYGTASPGSAGRTTVRVSGNTFAQVTDTLEGQRRANYQFTTAGNVLTLTQTCAFREEPFDGKVDVGFTASSAGFTFLFREDALASEQTFAKK